jgi:hypothetical protein
MLREEKIQYNNIYQTGTQKQENKHNNKINFNRQISEVTYELRAAKYEQGRRSRTEVDGGGRR